MTGLTTPRTPTLDEAWAEVEAIGPTVFEWGGLSVSGYRCAGGCEHDYTATAMGPNGERETSGHGATPTAALVALAAKLRKASK